MTEIRKKETRSTRTNFEGISCKPTIRLFPEMAIVKIWVSPTMSVIAEIRAMAPAIDIFTITAGFGLFIPM